MEKKLRILLVQCDKCNKFIFELMLRATKNVEIVYVDLPSQALTLIENTEIDLVVSDIIGDVNLNGIELAEKIRLHKNQAISRIPLIVWTAYNLIHDKQKALEAGFDVFLPMPDTKKNQMLEAIKMFIPIHEAKV